MFVDSHCHLSFPDFADRLSEELQAMREAGVERALCICTTLEEFPRVHGLALTHAPLWATVGVHPDQEDVIEPSVDDLVQRARLPRVLAIGETGLDYYQLQERKGGRSVADLEWQRDRFRRHIRAARQVGKPMVIHTRDSAADTLRILREEGEGGPASAGGVFHCFTESAEVARQVLDMGFYISYSGIITFRNAQALREVARLTPLERTLIETDSPYLAPVPHRGKTNSPAHVPWVARQLAEIHGLTVESIAERTRDNFDRLFRPS